jgi:uncharacterized membrane protein YgcG
LIGFVVNLITPLNAMDATFFIWLAGFAILMIMLWKFSAYASVRPRNSRLRPYKPSSFSSNDAVNHLPMVGGGYQTYDTPNHPQSESSSTGESPTALEGYSSSDSGSSFSDCAGGSFDCGGGDSGGGD